MGLGDVPRKVHDYIEEERFTFSFTLGVNETIQFARVKEVLGGYTNQELIQKLVKLAINEYFDGQMPKNSSLPKKLTVQRYQYESERSVEQIFGKIDLKS